MAVAEQVAKKRELERFPLSVEVEADDTLNDFVQVIRMDCMVDPFHFQAVFDRRHKQNPKLSRPLGYYHFSEVRQLIGYAMQGLVAACVLNLKHSPQKPSDVKISQSVDGLIELILPDVKHQVSVVLKQASGEMPRYTMNHAGRKEIGGRK